VFLAQPSISSFMVSSSSSRRNLNATPKRPPTSSRRAENAPGAPIKPRVKRVSNRRSQAPPLAKRRLLESFAATVMSHLRRVPSQPLQPLHAPMKPRSSKRRTIGSSKARKNLLPLFHTTTTTTTNSGLRTPNGKGIVAGRSLPAPPNKKKVMRKL
jgi:hypothetical protein